MTALAERIGRAMSDANKAHVLTHRRELTLKELGEVAAREFLKIRESAA